VEHPAAGEPVRWQTPRQRHLAQQAPFHLAVGWEITPGVPAETLHPVLVPDSEISWIATLQPFANELSAGTDWINFGGFSKPGPDVQGVAQQWTWADERNPYLDQAIPGRFVRAAVIKNANADMRWQPQQGARSRRMVCTLRSSPSGSGRTGAGS
jgi:hypothetical protein